jgi:hypothetical protein
MKNEMDRHVACMERRFMHTEFWWGSLRKRDYWEGMDWTDLALDRDRCWPLVNQF